MNWPNFSSSLLASGTSASATLRASVISGCSTGEIDTIEERYVARHRRERRSADVDLAGAHEPQHLLPAQAPLGMGGDLHLDPATGFRLQAVAQQHLDRPA